MHTDSKLQKLGYSIDEAAHAIGLSRTSVKNLIATGRLRTVHVGRRVVIPRGEVDALLAPSESGNVMSQSVGRTA
jgi:excisionase family DNA binding protein